MIFIGALSTTFFAIAPSTCAALIMPTGELRFEKIPPSTPVTMAASAEAARIAAAPASIRSPRSIFGAGRITSRTLVSSRTANEVTIVSRPTVPRISSPRATSRGTGSWRRRTSRMSARVSSGSHSAPSGDAMVASSGMDRLPAREREIGKLTRRDHADDGLVLVGHDRKTTALQGHERDHLADTLVLVDEQRRLTQHVPCLHRRRRRTYREVAAGHHDVAGDEAVDDVLFGDVAHGPAVDEHDHLAEDVVREQLGDGVRRRARQAEHHLVAHHRPHLRIVSPRRPPGGI